MVPTLESIIRLIEDVFPGTRLFDGYWREIRPATAAERQRWGWVIK